MRRRKVWLHARPGRKRRALVDGLFVRIGKTLRALRLGERQHGDVAVVALPFLSQFGRERADAEERRARCGDGQNGGIVQRPRHRRLARDGVLHRVVGLDGLPARATPAGACPHRHLDAEAVGLGDRVAEEFQPLRAQELHGAARRTSRADLEDQHAADAGRLHRVEVSLHALARRVAVHEVPVHPRAGGVRRVCKRLFERRGGC